MMLINFDEWTRDAQPTMQAVAEFLKLSPHTFKLEQAHTLAPGPNPNLTLTLTLSSSRRTTRTSRARCTWARRARVT